MIKTIENDMNKVLLKTDILLEAICDYYNIDYIIVNQPMCFMKRVIVLLKKQSLYLNL